MVPPLCDTAAERPLQDLEVRVLLAGHCLRGGVVFQIDRGPLHAPVFFPAAFAGAGGSFTRSSRARTASLTRRPSARPATSGYQLGHGLCPSLSWSTRRKAATASSMSAVSSSSESSVGR